MFIRASSRGCTAGSSGAGTHAPAPRSTVVPGLGHSFFLHPFPPPASVQSSRCTWLSPGLPGNRSEVAHRVRLCSRRIILSLVQTQSTHPAPREPGLRCWTRDRTWVETAGGGALMGHRGSLWAPNGGTSCEFTPFTLSLRLQVQRRGQQPAGEGSTAQRGSACPQRCYNQAGRLAGEERNLNYTSYEVV